MIHFDSLMASRNSFSGGRNQEFYDYIAARDISAAKAMMNSNRLTAIEALREYKPETHEITKRADKIKTNKKGDRVGVEKVWKLPIPYQQYINEVALIFLYARPIRWSNNTEGTDAIFAKFLEVIKDTRFDAKIRQAKRLAGSETESALLFRVFENSGKPDVQIRVLANSKGDELYTRFDQYENLISFAWGYYTVETNGESVYHFDVFEKDVIFRCTKASDFDWKVEEEQNLIGKIPVIYLNQEKEWSGVEHLIHREEFIASRTADTNDYFADPIAIMNADVIRNLPEKSEVGKLLITNSQGGVDSAMKFETWDSAPESKRQELEWLQSQILSKSFTPNITLDTLKSVSQLSAKALKTVMMLADIKASRRKETHDEYIDRVSSLIVAIIANVLDVSLASEAEVVSIAHEFQEPFGEDVVEGIENIIKAVEAGILSRKTAIALNPLVKDAVREEQLINENEEAETERKNAIFSPEEQELGALSFE